MLVYIVRRLIEAIPSLIGVTLVGFMLLHLKGDPMDLILPPEATPASKEAVRRAYGLDQPLYVQYGKFLWNAVQGKFGESIGRGGEAGKHVFKRMPASLYLALAAVGVSILVGVPLGILAALRQNSPLDYVTLGLVALGQSIAGFWLALLLILAFGVYFHLFPVAGGGTVSHLVLPALSLSLGLAALIVRLVRSSMLEVIRQDYVRTARAKGLAEHIVVIRHALRNALIPVVTVIGLNFSALLGGAVIIEIIFSYPGVGSLIYDAVANRDYPIVLAGVTVVATLFVLILLAVDLLYGLIDPRIRYG